MGVTTETGIVYPYAVPVCWGSCCSF